jgi:hypothetical protein
MHNSTVFQKGWSDQDQERIRINWVAGSVCWIRIRIQVLKLPTSLAKSVRNILKNDLFTAYDFFLRWRKLRYQVPFPRFEMPGLQRNKINKNLEFFVWKCSKFKIRIHNFLKMLDPDPYKLNTASQLDLDIQRVNLHPNTFHTSTPRIRYHRYRYKKRCKKERQEVTRHL